MIIEVHVDDLVTNRYNSRFNYVNSTVERLADSMELHGQLLPLRVRPTKTAGKYEVVFGHRRLLAAKKLGWKTVKAEVVDLSDEDALVDSLVENLERENLSDYEKAVIFERFNVEFGKTYEEIGKMVGLTKQAISNHVAMLKLFNAQYLVENPDLVPILHEITEHHARVLARAEDVNDRASLLRLTQKDKLSVRDLSNLVFHLRSWFHSDPKKENESADDFKPADNGSGNPAERTISYVVKDKFTISERGDLSLRETVSV